MKKVLVVLLVVLVAVFSVNAMGPEFGVKAGLTLGNVVWGDEEAEFSELDNPLKFGLTGGVMMEMPMGPISIGAEVLYTQKGEKFTYDFEKSDLLINFKLDYIEVPVMAKLNLLPIVKVYGGVSFGFLTTAEVVYEEDGEEVESMDIKDEMKSTEMGAIMGVQVKISKLVLDARYNHGLTNIINDDSMIDNELKLRTLSATVGFMF